MDTTAIALEGPGEEFSPTANPKSRTSILGELQCVVDQRFGSIDLGVRVSRDVSKLIGFGTYGNVYEGTLHPEQTKVAVKTVRYGDKSALPVLKKVLREVYVWSKLKHENVAELLGITTSYDHTISIVSPLTSRGNAFDYVRNSDVDPRPLILGIANGLHYLHTFEKGPIIHGDVKGPNVLVSDDGRALLTDFGFSHLANASFSLAVEQRPGGTLNWMAPEYLDEGAFTMTTAGDVWAFGMTALELFTRKCPFDHLKNTGAIMYHIIWKDQERPSSDASCSRMTDEWWNMCLLCWSRDPSQRASIVSIVEIINTLQTFAKADTASLPRESSTGNSVPRASIHNRGLISINTISTSRDPSSTLHEIARQASQDYIILDGRLSRDTTSFIRAGYSCVYAGTLSLKRKGAVVTTIGGGSRDQEKVLKVAIKTVVSSVDIDFIKNIPKEARLWSKLRHEHVLPFLGITTDFDLTVSIVTPWMKKGNAHDYVQDPDIDPRPLIRGIAQGLHYLHNHSLGPIIHGDMKGVNVLISDDGRALIHNFGFSRLVGGTLTWMAPEMLESGEQSISADVWAFGMTVLELFTRQSPYHKLDPKSIIIRILSGPPHRPTDEEMCFRMSDNWWQLCLSCWNLDASLRPTMLDIVQEIGKMIPLDERHVNRPSMPELYSFVQEELALEEFSKLASSYGFDLDVEIEQHGATSHRDCTNIAFRGMLRHPEETMVAVKAIRGNPPHNTEIVKSIVSSVSALIKIRHENILPILGVTTKFHSRVSLVSEWMENGNAREYVQNGGVDPNPLLLGVAIGLQYLHSQVPHPIFHGALKGSNILISPSGQALLTDFGLLDLNEPPFLANRVGTINWTSPEHLNDLKGSAAGDVWAFGMTMLELFTRALPFDSILNSDELERCIWQGPPDRPCSGTTCQRLTDGWWRICLLCWSHEPSQRPSIDEVLEMIEDELFRALRRQDRSRMQRMLVEKR